MSRKDTEKKERMSKVELKYEQALLMFSATNSTPIASVEENYKELMQMAEGLSSNSEEERLQ